MCTLFWLPFGAFFFAICVGACAYYAKRFEDINTIEEIDKFIKDKSKTSEIFVEQLGRQMYKYIQLNEQHIAKKSSAVKIMAAEED